MSIDETEGMSWTRLPAPLDTTAQASATAVPEGVASAACAAGEDKEERRAGLQSEDLERSEGFAGSDCVFDSLSSLHRGMLSSVNVRLSACCLCAILR